MNPIDSPGNSGWGLPDMVSMKAKTRVILITHDHHYSGSLATQGLRLVDLLNDDNRCYLRLEEVGIYRRTETDSCIADLPEAVVRKADISLAVLEDDRQKTSEKRWNRFVRKRTFEAFLAVSGFEIRGKLHLVNRPRDLSLILVQELGSFFPVTQAVVSHADLESRFDASVIIVNKSRVSLLYESTRALSKRARGLPVGADLIPNSVFREGRPSGLRVQGPDPAEDGVSLPPELSEVNPEPEP